MKTPTELERLQSARNVDTEWLARYLKIVQGLEAFASMYAEGCEEKWLAMEYSLHDSPTPWKKTSKAERSRNDQGIRS